MYILEPRFLRLAGFQYFDDCGVAGWYCEHILGRSLRQGGQEEQQLA